MSLAEDIKAYRKKSKHSMADVSQITGIPADRIYKWEKGTKPNNAEDLLKIRDYLSGKLETLPVTTLETEQKEDDTTKQILLTLAQAFKAQTEILQSMRQEMAREQTQVEVVKKMDRMLANFADQEQVDILSAQFQEARFDEIKGLLTQLKPPRKGPSGDEDNIPDGISVGGKTPRNKTREGS